MSTYLKQSTAVEVKIGPFVDNGDGFTPETTLTISQADKRLAKNGGDWAQTNESTSLVHEEFGWYRCLLDTTDTDTLGILILAISETGALPVWREFMVIPANVYDSLVAGSDTLDVQVTGIGADVITAASIANGAIDAATFAAGAITATVVADGTIDAATFAAGAINAAAIADGAIDAATFAAGAIDSAAVAADIVAEIADAVWDEDATGHQTQGTFGQTIGDSAADTGTIYGAVVTGAAGTTIAADIIAIKTETATILADTNDIQNTLIGFVLEKGTLGATGNDSTHLHLPNFSYGDDEINGYFITVYDVTEGEFHVREITDWANSGNLATVDTLPFTPQASVDLYWLTGEQSGAGGSAPTAAEVADAVWDEDATGHQTGGTFGQAIGDPGASTETLFKAIVTDPAGTNIAADVIAIKADTAAILVDTAELQTDWTNGGRLDLIIDDILVDTGTTLQGELDGIQADTEDIQSRLPAALVGGTRIDASVGAVANDAITAASIANGAIDANTFAAGAITAAAIATDAIDADALAADAVDEIWNEPMTDIAAVPTATGTFRAGVNWMVELARNKVEQTATTTTVYKDDGSTAFATSTVSDDGTTFTRSEFS